MSFVLSAYHGLMSLMDPLAISVLRRLSKSLDEARVNERRGFSPHPRPEGFLIWLHGVSVGEALCALSLSQILASKNPVTFLITTHTQTAAHLIEKRCREGTLIGIIHQYAPIDTPQSIERFLNHWRPDVHIGIEQDIWPGWLKVLKSMAIPAHLVSARLTDRSVSQWQKLPKTIKTVLSYYEAIWPQDTKSQSHFQKLGAIVKPILNLKTIGTALKFDHGLKHELLKTIGDRPIWLAASTHHNEETLITLSLEQALEKNHLLIICPRHTDRADEIETLLTDLGHSVLRRSRGEKPGKNTKVYLADSLGEMGLWFELSNHIIMGGSFFPQIGGHNPLEPARLKKGVISGPYVENWAGIYSALQDHTACLIAQDRDSLSLIVSNLMIDSDRQDDWNKNAFECALRLEASNNAALLTLSTLVLAPSLEPKTTVISPC